VQGYQAVLLEGRWPDPVTWLGLGAWLVLTWVVLQSAVSRSREQLVDWL
jgi:lipopolysaccharide transport system permease protein